MTLEVKNVINPGDVKVNSVIILNRDGKFVDVTQMFAEINFFEDLMAPFVTGNITIIDAISLSAQLPFIGEEVIELSLETPTTGSKVKKTFHVYKMTNRERVKEKAVVYTLHFVSVEGYVDINSSISKTYKGTCGEIATKIITSTPGLNRKNNYIVDETSNTLTYTSNFWSPSKNLLYVAENALSKENNPNFLVWETLQTFNFVSLDTLYKQPSVISFIRDNKIRDVNSQGESLPSTAEEMRRILDLSSPVVYDYVERVQSGMYGSSMYHYDVQTKRLRFMQKFAKEEYQHTTLNRTTIIDNSAVFRPSVNVLSEIIHKDMYPNTVQLPYDHVLKRMSLLSQSGAIKMSIKVFGDFAYKVGDVVELVIYKDTNEDSKSDQTEKDNVLSGRYLVSALNHNISVTSHYCNIELIKDSIIK